MGNKREGEKIILALYNRGYAGYGAREIYETFTVHTDILLIHAEYNYNHECISPFP